jgi:hypothetical protein
MGYTYLKGFHRNLFSNLWKFLPFSMKFRKLDEFLAFELIREKRTTTNRPLDQKRLTTSTPADQRPALLDRPKGRVLGRPGSSLTRAGRAKAEVAVGRQCLAGRAERCRRLRLTGGRRGCARAAATWVRRGRARGTEVVSAVSTSAAARPRTGGTEWTRADAVVSGV